MKLNYITILVRDLDKSLKFYTELTELQVIRKINPPVGEIVFLANDDGETMLELAKIEGVDAVETKSLALSFLCDDLEKTHSKSIELGYKPSEIFNNPPKPKYFNLPDPDGIMIEFSHD